MAGTSDVATKLASEYNITVASAKTMVVTVLDAIIEIARKERIKVGNHIFKPTETKERNGRNPKTGEPLVIPAKKGIKYKWTGGKEIVQVAPPANKKASKKPKK